MSTLLPVKVPDIGDFSNIPVIEILVKVGDRIALEDPVATLESDKATLDVPSSVAGIVREVAIKLGDKVSEGSLLIQVEALAADQPPPPPPPAATAQPLAATSTAVWADSPSAQAPVPPAAPAPSLPTGSKAHATPSVRAFARELGVDLTRVTPSGPKNRILKDDISAWVKKALSTGSSSAGGSLGGGLDLLPWPKIDFAKFGPIESRPLSRIGKISGQNLARNWVMIPAVTYHEDADITELEAFRQQINKEQSGVKLTLLAFLIKASAKALQQFPDFNTSLATGENGEMNLVLKKYFHIGFAADTPNGLVVPVIRDADKKSVLEIAAESGALAKAARDGKLKPTDMQGACFTISSLGGIGGTYFSPIVNAPEVAILGVNKAALKPVWDGQSFAPRLIVPLSLSADHRVIDGAQATRFNVYLAELLADFRRVAL